MQIQLLPKSWLPDDLRLPEINWKIVEWFDIVYMTIEKKTGRSDIVADPKLLLQPEFGLH